MEIDPGAPGGRVLVLGEDTRTFLAVVRSLGRMGLEVHVAWCSLNAAALQSKYVCRLHILPECGAPDNGWLAAFNALLREYNFDLVIPCTDGIILPLQMHSEALVDSGRVVLLPDAVYRTCANKEETWRLASRLKIPVPAQIVASTVEDIRAAASQFGYPLVLKPRTSASIADPSSRQTVRKIRRPADLESGAAEMLHGGRQVLVQQNFIGKGVGVELLLKDGEMLTAFQHERVHEPLMGGGSTYRKSAPLDSGMLDASCRLMRELRFTGVAMVEFKRDPASGHWVLIEINARFWGSLPLSIAAGLDFPRFLYEMLCRGRTEFPRSYRHNLYSRNWRLDFEWLRDNASTDHRDPDLMTVSLPKVAAEIANVLLLRERSDTFVLDDLRPAVADLAHYFSHIGFALKKRIGLLRKREQWRALKALRRARNILFVCHGNICRSPFAEAVLLQVAPVGVAASSSGSFPRAGRGVPEAAAEAARRLGVDLAAHRSRVVSRAECDAADVIFIFERRNLEALLARFPDVGGKIHLLGSLDPAGSLEIEDPYDTPVERFVECYTRIARIVHELGARLETAVRRRMA